MTTSLQSIDAATGCLVSEQLETRQLRNTLLINIGVCIVLVLVFEFNRHMNSIYQKRRMKDKFVRTGRVPPEPDKGLLGWVRTLNTISEEDMLQMVGLDGYMLMRYINICFHITLFIAIWGVCVLAPFYAKCGNAHCPGTWDRYTLGNIPMETISDNASSSSGDFGGAGLGESPDGWSQLWAPAIFAYVFSGYFCMIMYNEYHNYLEKRVQYLQKGDPDTPIQAYYTVMVEKIPASLRNSQALADFFDNLFPGEVYGVQLAADLHELEALVSERRTTRDALEKAIAVWEASGRQDRPTHWVTEDEYLMHRSHLSRAVSKRILDRVAAWSGFRVVDAIDYYSCALQDFNESARRTQQRFLREETSVVLPEHQLGVRADAVAPVGLYDSPFRNTRSPVAMRAIGAGSTSYQDLPVTRLLAEGGRERDGEREPLRINVSSLTTGTNGSSGYGSLGSIEGSENGSSALGSSSSSGAASTVEYAIRMEGAAEAGISPRAAATPARAAAGDAYVADGEQAAPGTNRSFARWSLNDMATPPPPPQLPLDAASAAWGRAAGAAEQGIERAAKGVLRGVLDATRTLELLTVGAYYKTSSTAFVTLKSRVASSSCHQMQLSHRHFTMSVRAAPNPKDLVWSNVMIPQRQIDVRRTIADVTLVIGALLWSLVLGFITRIASLETLSQQYTWVRARSGTTTYRLFNTYLASSVLLCLLASLPFVFTLIARSYEGLKLKSEVQNSIMTRYFYYQLANVFVSVYAGSIVTALHEIIESPTNLFNILGSTIPSFSFYFVNLIIVKTFTAVPIEMLRVWPLIQILSLKLCLNKRKCTWRELRTGAFRDPRVLYGWIYPSLMMVLMIVLTYACISPLLTPLGVVYYTMTYYMYKYQLLYVFINEYQSGGYMWNAVFKRSMIALICAVVTVVCYLGYRRNCNYGPFYFTLPLPFLIFHFKNSCERKFQASSMSLSLESALELDRGTYAKRMAGHPPDASFKPKLFRQPSLAEGPLRPGPYRPTVAAASKAPLSMGTAAAAAAASAGGYLSPAAPTYLSPGFRSATNPTAAGSARPTVNSGFFGFRYFWDKYFSNEEEGEVQGEAGGSSETDGSGRGGGGGVARTEAMHDVELAPLLPQTFPHNAAAKIAAGSHPGQSASPFRSPLQQAQPKQQLAHPPPHPSRLPFAARASAASSVRRGSLSPQLGAAPAAHVQSKREEGDSGEQEQEQEPEQEPPPYEAEDEAEVLTPELVTGRHQNHSRWAASRDSFLNDFADMALVEDAAYGTDLAARDGDGDGDEDDYEVELVTNAENEVNATGEMVEVSELLEFPLSPPKPEEAGAVP